MAISPDGHWLVTGSADNTARLWDLRMENLLATARRTAGRELTSQERKRFLLPESVGPAEQPNKLRTWLDASGTRETEAQFVSQADGMVTLKRADSKVFTIPSSKLSHADQEHLRQLATPDIP